jgi:glycosyltransferase involved in cell wall biosynthesis
MTELIDKKPLVSVIIIFFNAEKENFFEEAIASVFAQTYSNWELLLVDDGSTDKSTQVAHEYARKYSDRVLYLEHEGHQNRGKSVSRNLGIATSRGKYIALLDADDIWLPEKLERQVNILEAHSEAGMVYGSTLMWHSWTGRPEDMKQDRQRLLGVQPDILVQPPTLLTLILQRKAETPGTCGVLMRRTTIEEVGGFVESFQEMSEDMVLFSKIFLKEAVFIESGCWDLYRQHPNSSCYRAEAAGQYSPIHPNPSQLIFLRWLEGYLSDQEINEPELWKSLEKALFPYQYPNLYRLLNQLHLLPERVMHPKRSITNLLKKLYKRLPLHEL